VTLLDVANLAVSFDTPEGVVEAVRGLSFNVERGKTLAIVGESGAGKSVAAHTILGLVRGARVSGTAKYDGRDLLALAPRALRAIRGAEIAMIFQNPHSSLHPAFRIGTQIEEAIRIHRPASHADTRRQAIELLGQVGIVQPERRVDDYPHQYSGGMLQRAMIAMAIALRPRLLIADEPTTALDVTVQAQILRLLRALQAEMGLAIVLITHDFGVVAGMADDILVMREGRSVEYAPHRSVLLEPKEEYTRSLLTVVPKARHVAPATGHAIVIVERVVRQFENDGAGVLAVDDVSLEIMRGETLSIVGETGSGKSTLARCVTRLTDVTSGHIRFDGTDITSLDARAMRPVRRRMQMVFQDPFGSLNPRRTVGASLEEPLVIHEIGDQMAREARVRELIEMVGLEDAHRHRFPSELSGGQLQRACIARAIALNPDVLVCDEPVSALDVSIRAQILNLFIDLQARLGLTCLFISHDLSVVRHISDRVGVMQRGRIVEIGTVKEVFEHPRHEYTRLLLSSVPSMNPDVARAYLSVRNA
jgi:peptide/nickel transport system ATP-binding protein